MAGDEPHDWEIIARRDPWFGVLSNPAFRSGAITPEHRRDFYASGEDDIARLLTWFDQDLGARPSTGRALDIGCGVGRLTYAMAKIVPAVTGYDVADSMLALAREQAPPNAEFSITLPPGPFAWINSYIVFQHIPPPEGLRLLDDALSRASPDCFLSLHITFWRDLAAPKHNLISNARRQLARSASRKGDTDAAQLIRMHDYAMSEVMRRLTASGFSRIVMRHTNHGGHHGAWLIARRS
ncbi:MAG: class I SAM-dependent methyltransferase [Hyphomonadaceae bacterium]|nr:class I SAM-dependent methyltransferase [Hyphomonadaceae bacterium]